MDPQERAASQHLGDDVTLPSPAVAGATKAMSRFSLLAVACLLGMAVLLLVLGCQSRSSGGGSTAAPADDGTGRRDPAALGFVARASALGSQGNHTEAINLLRKALAIDPSMRAATSALAFELMQAGRVEEAVPLWRDLARQDDQIGRRAQRMLAKMRR